MQGKLFREKFPLHPFQEPSQKRLKQNRASTEGRQYRLSSLVELFLPSCKTFFCVL